MLSRLEALPRFVRIRPRAPRFGRCSDAATVVTTAMARANGKSSPRARRRASRNCYKVRYLMVLISNLRQRTKSQPRPSGEWLERALALRRVALALIGASGRWQALHRGHEVKQFEDERLLIMFHVMPPAPPPQLHKMPGRERPLCGLYRLKAWDKPIGKVTHLAWNTVGGALPRIVIFRRGQREERSLHLHFSPPLGPEAGPTPAMPVE
jgi:hypothetical protein